MSAFRIPLVFRRLKMNYFIQCITKKCVDFSGRARRAEFWNFVLFYALLFFPLLFLGEFLTERIENEIVNSIINCIFLLVMIPLWLSHLSVTVRRLHDTNKSGFGVLLGLIPVIGGFILLIFMLMPGDAGDNQYGLDPKSNPDYNEADAS